MRYLGWLHLLLCLCVIPVYSQQTPTTSDADAALLQKIRDLEDRVISLEGQVRTLKAQGAPAPASETTATAAATPTPEPLLGQSSPSLGGAGGSAAKALNPDISMIGDFISVGGHNTVDPSPSLQMHESEIGMQAIIDPYARGDFFLSFGEEGVNLEEGYITFTALPAGIVARVGKMRSAFGKVNTLHNHVLPWIDRPLVTDNLVGGEDGIDDAGWWVTRAFAGPKGLFLEGTGQVFRGDSADLFKSSQRDDVSVVGHFRGYEDITESTSIDLGGSYARGHNDLGSQFLTNLYDIDATVRWKPLRRSIYHSFDGRSELIWSRREQIASVQRSFGMYASGDYQFARRWFFGARFDRSDRARERLRDRCGALVLTYWPSEFSQLRGEYRLSRYGENITSNELRFQVQFVLGAHGAHPF